jgi:hypothetical protein
MKVANRPDTAAFVIAELLLAAVLSFIFLRWAMNSNSSNIWGKTIGDSVIRMYALISMIFFFSVFTIRIFGAIRLKKANQIGRAIGFSFLFWILSLVAFAFFTRAIGPIPSLYILLIGVIVGFNFGLEERKVR